MWEKIKTNPVVIVGQGPSAEVLKDNIELFRDKDVIWSSLNRYYLIEPTLARIEVNLDMACIMSRERFAEIHGKIITPHLITNSRICLDWAISEMNPFVYVSDFGFGFSTLFAFLCALGKLGAKKVCLVGFDGKADGEHVYFNQKQIKDNFEARRKSIWRDTVMMNKCFWDYWDYIGLKDIDIVNLEGSAIECFRQCPIRQMAKELA